MMELIIFCLTTFAASWIISRESIFRKFRVYVKKKNNFLGELVSCPFCISVYLGYALFFIAPGPFYVAGMISYAFTKMVGTYIMNNEIVLED